MTRNAWEKHSTRTTQEHTRPGISWKSTIRQNKFIQDIGTGPTGHCIPHTPFDVLREIANLDF